MSILRKEVLHMGIFKKFEGQFGKPQGLLGRIAGKLMELKGTEKIEWTISLLDIRKDDKILEIGYGPGVAIELLSKLTPNGYIVGIDHSELIFTRAQKRNWAAIKEGRVDLRLGDVARLPSFEIAFDKVLSVNTIFFWEEPTEILKQIRRVMKPGGVIALTVQPFNETDEKAKEYGHQMMNYLEHADFTNVRMEIKPMKPVASVCVLGMK
jgi:ubiquinone/menaquinone biosynthesis C-methylase UbiE